jgi:hypothetical protein
LAAAKTFAEAGAAVVLCDRSGQDLQQEASEHGCRLQRKLSARALRVDTLLKLPPEDFMRVCVSGNSAEQMLALRAVPLVRKRLEKRLAKYCRRRNTTPPTSLPIVDGDSVSSGQAEIRHNAHKMQ